MRWEDERYVRLYTRKTIGWRMLPWQSKALLPLLLREVDRAGLLDLDEYGAAGVAVAVELPIEVVEPGLKGLIDRGAVEIRGCVLVLPNFLAAQEAASSDAQRKRDQRERDRATARLNELDAVTERDESSRNGTESHERSLDVTSGHSVPIRSEPSEPSVPSEKNNPDSAIAASGPVGAQGFKLEPPAATSSPGFDFEAVYALYPRKEGKKKGLERARRIIASRSRFEQFTQAVRNYAARVAGRDPDKVKHFDTFVGCWEDYVAPATATPSSPAASRAPSVDILAIARERDAKAAPAPPEVLAEIEKLRSP